MTRLSIVLLWFACFTPAQTPRCVEVEGDRILARDFAVSLPGFGGLSPETAIAPAPQPGVHRFFRPFELAALAHRYSVELDPDAFTVRFQHPGMMLDLGAIGKGYAIDCAVETLREAGVTSALPAEPSSTTKLALLGVELELELELQNENSASASA